MEKRLKNNSESPVHRTWRSSSHAEQKSLTRKHDTQKECVMLSVVMLPDLSVSRLSDALTNKWADALRIGES